MSDLVRLPDGRQMIRGRAIALGLINDGSVEASEDVAPAPTQARADVAAAPARRVRRTKAQIAADEAAKAAAEAGDVEPQTNADGSEIESEPDIAPLIPANLDAEGNPVVEEPVVGTETEAPADGLVIPAVDLTAAAEGGGE